MADATTTGKNADILNTTLNQNKQVGGQGVLASGQGLAAVGNDQLANSLRMLGISEDAISTLLGDTTKSRTQSQDLHNSAVDRAASSWGNIVSQSFL